MSEQARMFLERVMPEFPEGKTAYLNVHWASPNPHYDPTLPASGNNQIKFWDGRACTSIREAVSTMVWAKGQAGRDLYVCMSLQARRETKTSKTGHTYYKAMRYAADAVSLRSIFVDVDVKPTAYPTTSEAFAALHAFVVAMGLPMPSAVVKSGGGGFHVHWALEEAISPAEWQILANAMAAATRDKGLLCDPQCTIDSARILRIPDTLNFKYDPPAPVELFSLTDAVTAQSLYDALEPYIGLRGGHGGQQASPQTGQQGPAAPQGGAEPAMGNPKPTTPVTEALNAVLGANIATFEGNDIDVADVMKSCGFVANAMGTGGVSLKGQPLWFLMATLSTHLADGRTNFHAMSAKNPYYRPQDADDLFDRVSVGGKDRDIGWTQCSKIAATGAPECQTCPLLALNKSPLNFAIPPAASAASDDTLPERYVRDAAGLISIKSTNDDGSLNLIKVSDYPITTGWLSNNPWMLHFATRTEYRGKTEMELPTEVIFQREGIAKHLGAKGLFCTDFQYKLLKEFFVAWIQKLQGLKDSVISAAPFGWSVVDGKIEGFTYAGRVWKDGDDRPAANPNPVLAYQYTPKGELSVWREAAAVINDQNRPGLDAVLAVAFAGPLVRFTGFPGLILNSYSAESGIGKTTAMKISQAVWGNPVLAMQGLNDTSNSVLAKMGQIRSIPMYWDEIKSDAQIKRFCSIVFDLTGGREKTRLNSDATLKVAGQWQTMMVSASNDSLVDGMGREVGNTTAGLHRLFEFAVPKAAAMSHNIGVVQRLLGRLDDNYGAAGLIYAKYLGRNWKRIEQEVARLQDELYNEAAIKQEERMWIATMAILLKGAEYANALGLTDINIADLKSFLVGTLNTMRLSVNDSISDLNKDMSISTILADFLNSTRARNTLITNRIWVGQGRPPQGSIKVRNQQDRLGDLWVQIGRDDRMIRISSTAFTRWMGERNYSRQTFLKRMEDEFGLKKTNGKLGGGTDMACAMEHLLELDMNHPKLSSILE